MRSRRRIAGVVALGALTLATGGCGADRSGSGGSASANEPLRVGIFQGAPVSAMVGLADQEGFFADHGVEVDVQPYATGQAMVSALVAGDADIALVGPNPIAAANRQGACLRALVNAEQNTMDVIARPGVDLPNVGKPYPQPLRDLAGKKIGITSRAGLMEANFEELMKAAGLEPGDATFVAVGGTNTAIAALRRGSVDVLYSIPPMLSELKPDEYQMLQKLVGEKGNAIEQVLQGTEATTCGLIESQPKSVQAYCAAIRDAFAYAKDESNTAAMGQFMTEFLGVDARVGDEVWKDYKSTFPAPDYTEALHEAQEPFMPPGTPLPPYGEMAYPPCATGAQA
jgi:NitT/TauT family transport system substrate-binding protein